MQRAHGRREVARESAEAGQGRVLELIASGAPLAETLDALVRVIEAQMPGTRATILLLDEDGVHLRHGAAPSLSAAYRRAVDGQPIGPAAGSCGTAAWRREAVIVEDIARDPLWSAYRAAAQAEGLRACWSTPIFDPAGKVLGTFALYPAAPGRPAEPHLKLIAMATHTAAIALLREREERARRESEARYRTLAESSPDAILVHSDGRIAQVNAAMLELLGAREAADVLGRPATFMLPPDLAGHAQRRIDALYAGKALPRAEQIYRRLDGSALHVEVASAPMQLDGRPAAHVTVRDITERKRAEEELSRFRAAMDHSADMILLIDRASMRFIDVNATVTRLLGYTRAEMLARGPQDVLPVSREELERAYDALIARPAAAGAMNSYYLCKDGSRLPFESTRHVLRSGEGWIIAAISRDIRQRIAAEAERRAQQKKIEGLSRINAVLGGISALIVRERDRARLFRDACRVAVEAGRFRAAWIGQIAEDRGRIEVIAAEGLDATYLSRLPLALDEAAGAAYGLGGMVARERRLIVIDDLADDPKIRLRREAAERNLHSAAFLPLLGSGRVCAVLGLYAAEAGFFNDEEVKLLGELAGDLSLALEHIDKSEQVAYLAMYDPLTGLANRSLFLERLAQNMRAAADEGRKVGIAVVDIERFKTINDSLGRQAGDELLKQVAQRFGGFAGKHTHLARLDRDHFAVMVSGLTTEEQAARLTEQRLKDCFGPPYVVGGTELRISAKIGIALHPGDGDDAETLLRNAESALKNAKASAEKYLFYTAQMSGRVAERLTLENKLKLALEREEFVLHYQPKVGLESGRIAGVEALIRWRNPELGLVPPGKFIPLLEETGLILEAGAWSLKRAAVDHGRWIEAGLAPPRVAVNVSPIQLRRKNFVATVEDALRGGAVGIDLEITESLVMEDIESNIGKLKEIRALGLSIAIDDFGTGYSSLAYLAKLPVQTLKIDRSFIITMLQDPDTMLLVRTIISLAHSLRLKVVAEGVDDAEQAKALRLLQCDEMQGYLYSKPLPFEELSALLARES